VLRATERAAGLTRQLLAFSRQQVIAPQDLDVNEVIEGSQRMLTRVIPSNVVFEVQLDRAIPPVHADRGQLEQVLLNLTINAVDAMPDGGSLAIRTSMAPAAHQPGVVGAPSAGRFVCVSVTDTGTGMSAETLARIFEPFFTTKAVGKGTGLGLATAHGIVTQSGGHLGVESEPGKGTTFTLFLPPSEGAVAAIAAAATPPSMYAVTAGTNGQRGPLATVLVVEDDPATREVTRRLLERSGYRILEAQDANAALVRLGDTAGAVDLVLTDVMMPGLSGVELAARIGERWPRMPVLMMSGYSDAEIRQKGALGRQRSLIEKPFTAAGLLTAVETALRE
jgi:two-component system cell cycle sensor histidine kinase/response regulator CckA